MTCVGCYAHTLVISAIGYTNCSLFSYIENTNLLTKDSLCLYRHCFLTNFLPRLISFQGESKATNARVEPIDHYTMFMIVFLC